MLRWFGQKEGAAKKAYRSYVEKGIEQGRRPELVGGGLIRFLGGGSALKALRRTGGRELSDDRISGSGEFGERIIKEAEAQIKYQLPVLEHNQRIKVGWFHLGHIKNGKTGESISQLYQQRPLISRPLISPVRQVTPGRACKEQGRLPGAGHQS